MNSAFLLLGTNLGDRKNNLDQALRQIKGRVGNVIIASKIYETEPWGEKDQPSFFNLAVLVDTELSPERLMTQINNIEKDMGRVRTELNRWKERTIDIDILFYNQLILNTENLTIPHPRFHMRKFAITPMFEIAPEFIHPIFKSSIKAILAESTDNSRVVAI